VGTNSCRLLVADVTENNLNQRLKRVVTTRIGENLQLTGWLKPQAIERTIDCLNQFVEEMRRWQVQEFMVVATSAVRDAYNRDDFLVLAQERIGLNIKVLTGEREGQLSYLGAKRGLNLKVKPIVVDVGGGSTEIIYEKRKTIVSSFSVGAVRATESDWDETTIKQLLSPGITATINPNRAPLVLVGGTATSLVALKKGMIEYDPLQVQGETITVAEIAQLYEMLSSLTLAQRMQLPGLQPERADIVLKGILIIKVIMEILNKEQAIVSDSDLLEGIVWTLVEEYSR
jgi:exopolyphosphatase/guanosine-5'-triphosphate,3'-diphosphate pyrophosphatase